MTDERDREEAAVDAILEYREKYPTISRKWTVRLIARVYRGDEFSVCEWCHGPVWLEKSSDCPVCGTRQTPLQTPVQMFGYR